MKKNMHKDPVLDKSNYQYKYFTFLSMLYCTLLILSVLLPYKIINFFGFNEPGGISIFPLTYLLGGAIAEGYGRQVAVRMVWCSIICLAIFNCLITIIVHLPSAPGAPNQDIFTKAFGSSPRLAISCIIGLTCSDLTNVYRITKLKAIFMGKYFWQRLLWTTALSEAIFNIVCYIFTYWGVISNSALLKLIIYSWILKMGYSLIMIFPLLYLMKFLKKSEGIDVYDVKSTKGLTPEEALAKIFQILKPQSTAAQAEID